MSYSFQNKITISELIVVDKKSIHRYIFLKIFIYLNIINDYIYNLRKLIPHPPEFFH